ncbi:unnamed protein product [Notodromas monacha]|uniref:Uncharacterized protein n=1 Tax=Notodromas monacha TaxID=399045 RepID=A0A7R9BWM6_9CRUS|nr:unnamed protein product [Notodromas monacha]CAG0921764.1 unnamed protein product [Notodromas monacha]
MPGALGTALATQTVQAQVEASVAMHVHICHVLLAEAAHTLFGEPFQVSSEAVQEELLDPKKSLVFRSIKSRFRHSAPELPPASSMNHGPSNQGNTTPINPGSSRAPPAAADDEAYVEKILDEFRKRHSHVAAEHVTEFSDLVKSSVSRLVPELQKPRRPSEVTVGNIKEAEAIKNLKTVPKKSAISRPASSKDTSEAASQSNDVSFNPDLLEVEIDNTHPVTEIFTSELLNYEAMLEKRLVTYAEFQRLVMKSILAAIRKANTFNPAEHGPEKTNDGLPNYSKLLCDCIVNNIQQQEEFMDCFFNYLGEKVDFPELANVRSDSKFPQEERSSATPHSSSSIRGFRLSTETSPILAPSKSIAHPGVLSSEFMIKNIAHIVKKMQPQFEVILFSFMELDLRLADRFLRIFSEKVPKVVSGTVTPQVLRRSSAFSNRIRKLALGPTYFTRAYQVAVQDYETKLKRLIADIAANDAEMKKRNLNVASMALLESKATMLKFLRPMEKAPVVRLRIIPPETASNVDESTSGAIDLAGPTRRRFMSVTDVSSSAVIEASKRAVEKKRRSREENDH